MGPNRTILAASLAAFALASGGCDLIDGGEAGGGADGGAGGPRADGSAGSDARRARDAGGSPQRIDVATWNLEFFPKDDATPERVAEAVRALGLDLVAVQEIADRGEFEALVDGLSGYDHVLSSHEYYDGSYQKLGFLFRGDSLEVVDVDLLFDDAPPACEQEGTTQDPFPRPPLEVTFAVAEELAGPGYEFTAIGVHHKAYFPPCDDDCRLRRACANRHLEAYVSGGEIADNVIVLGDFNETLDNGAEFDPFEPWEGSDYEILTSALGASDYSFVGFESLIDHAVVAEAFAPAFEGGDTRVAYLDRQRGDYTEVVSDHVPVLVSFEPR